MKKIYTIFAATAALLALAGCTNAIVQKNSAEVGWTAEQYENRIKELDSPNGNVTAAGHARALFRMVGANIHSTSTDGKSKTVKLTFSKDVDPNTVSGIKLYKTSDTADTTNTVMMYTETPISYTAQVIKYDVYVTFDPSTFRTALLEIDPAVLASVSGQKIDTDGDGVEGEADDDVYLSYYYSAISGTDMSLPASPAGLDKMIPVYNKLASPTVLPYDETDGTMRMTFDTCEDVFRSNIKIQYLSNGAWTDANVTSAFTKVADPAPANNLKGKSEATFTINPKFAPKTSYRVLLANRKSIKTVNKYRGYIRKLETDNFANDFAVLGTSFIGTYATTEYKKAHAADNPVAVTTVIDGRDYLTSFTVQLTAKGSLDGTTKLAADFCGVTDVLSKLLFKDGGANALSIGELIAQPVESSKTGPAGHEYYSKIKYVLKTPVYVNNNANMKVYVDPNLQLNYFDGTSVTSISLGFDNAKSEEAVELSPEKTAFYYEAN